MKIVYLTPVGGLGGAERALLSILGEMRRLRPQAKLVLIAGADGPLLDRSQRLGIETILLPMAQEIAGFGDSERNGLTADRWDWLRRARAALPSVWKYASHLQRLLGQLAPDLLHSNGVKMHLFAGLARPLNIPVVWHLHDFFGLRPVVPYLLKSLRRGLCGAIAVSQAVALDARRVLPGLPIKVIHNTVDSNTFRPDAAGGADLDRLASLPPASAGTIRVGLVTTYAKWKGQEIFLEAAARLARAPPSTDVRFFIIGGAIYFTRAQYTEPMLRRRAEELGIAERVGFIPFQQDLAGVYRSLDVVVHASTQPEPFGLTVAEAMACGRAVVVSWAGGVTELCTPEVDALGVAPGDVVGLANALQRLVADSETRLRLGTNARATALRRFHPARLGPQVLAVYERVLKYRLPSPVANA